MVAKTDLKARLFDLWGSVVELVRGEKRDGEQVARVLQTIKDNPNFAEEFFSGAAKNRSVETRQAVKTRSLRAQLRDWEKFYQDVFGLQKNFSGLKVPAKKPGFDRLLVVARGMTPNRIYNRMKELMPAWKYWGNLDSITSDRKADHDYAIWVQDGVEADEELKNKSADYLKAEGIPGITLEERLLYELKYFKETGKHLDMDNWTLCSGSRLPLGRVPHVSWRPDYGGVGVDWNDADGADGDLRGRQVVS